MTSLTFLPSPTCGCFSSCGVRSSSLRARRKKDSMTTLTLLQSSSSSSIAEPRNFPPSYFSRSSFPCYSSPPQQRNSRNSHPCLCASHSAIRCRKQSSLSLVCRSPEGQGGGFPGRGGRLWHPGLANRRCESSGEIGSSYDSSISPTTAGDIEEYVEKSLTAMATSPTSEGVSAYVAKESEEGVNDPQVSGISSLDLLHSSAGFISRHLRPISSTTEVPVSSSEDESWLFTDKAFSSNFITRAFQELRLGWFKNPQDGMVKLALLTLVFGLQGCSEAWAAGGAEMAQINVSPGLFDVGDFSDIQSGFASAFLLIFFSELGDKTFFIAALLATRKSGIAVFSGTFGALMAMTVISVCLGRAFHYIDGILPNFGLETKLPVDDIAAVILLVYFGVSTLLDAYYMDANGEEQQEAELAIADVGASGAVAGTVAATFALVFVAEWGDKSFFSTIALAAASSPLGVVIGAIAGHGAASLLAVLGGSFLGNYVSEKVIASVGGALFLVFAGVTVVEILN